MAGPNPASKNFALSPAAADLGLGAELVKQVNEIETARKKKLAMLQPQSTMLGGAAQALFGTGVPGG